MSEFFVERDSSARNLLRTVAATASLVLVLSGCAKSSVSEAEPTTTETTIPALQMPEAQIDATFQIRTVFREGMGGYDPSLSKRDADFNATAPNCTATHIDIDDDGKGDGWFLTASHCFSELHAGAQIYDDVYDAVNMYPKFVEIWQGDVEETKTKVGRADSIVIDGNYTNGDWALVHVPGSEKLPALPVTKDYAVDQVMENRRFFIAGYPQDVLFAKTDSEIEYTGLTSGAATHDTYGLGDNPAPMYTFVHDYEGSENMKSDIIFTPGMSGSSVADDKGYVLGDLSRYYAPNTPVWLEQKNSGYDLQASGNLGGFQPIRADDILQLITQKGTAPDPGSSVIYK